MAKVSDPSCLDSFPRLKEEVCDSVAQCCDVCDSANSIFVYHCNIRSVRLNWTQFICSVYHNLDSIDVMVLTEVNISKIESPFYEIAGFCKYEQLKPGGVIIFCQ